MQENQIVYTQQRIQTNNTQHHLQGRFNQSPSQKLQKQQKNFSLPSDSDQTLKQTDKKQFHRYKDKDNILLRNTLKYKKHRKFNDQQHSRSLTKTLQTSQSYKDWKVYKNKSDLNMLPFPYCLDQQSSSNQTKKYPFTPFALLNSSKNTSKQQLQQKQKPQLPRLYKLKIQNKIRVHNENTKENKVNRPYFNYQKTPINEYLNYELTQQINMGLRQVQIMAQQIKRIKKFKKIDNENIIAQKQKFNKGLRIRKSYVKNYKGLYKDQA